MSHTHHSQQEEPAIIDKIFVVWFALICTGLAFLTVYHTITWLTRHVCR